MDQLFTAFADKANLIGAAVVAVLSWAAVKLENLMHRWVGDKS